MRSPVDAGFQQSLSKKLCSIGASTKKSCMNSGFEKFEQICYAKLAGLGVRSMQEDINRYEILLNLRSDEYGATKSVEKIKNLILHMVGGFKNTLTKDVFTDRLFSGTKGVMNSSVCSWVSEDLLCSRTINYKKILPRELRALYKAFSLPRRTILNISLIETADTKYALSILTREPDCLDVGIEPSQETIDAVNNVLTGLIALFIRDLLKVLEIKLGVAFSKIEYKEKPISDDVPVAFSIATGKVF